MVCTFPDDESTCGLHIEHIVADDDLWLDCKSKCYDFFNVCVLPELLGRWCSRSCTCIKANGDSTSTSEENASTSTTCDYCYCKQSIDSDLIGCDNSNCPIEWFHMTCLKIKVI